MKLFDAGKWCRVSSLREASHRVTKTASRMGSSEWYERGGARSGLVVDAEGQPLARVSYNGRVWAVDENGRALQREIKLDPW